MQAGQLRYFSAVRGPGVSRFLQRPCASSGKSPNRYSAQFNKTQNNMRKQRLFFEDVVIFFRQRNLYELMRDRWRKKHEAQASSILEILVWRIATLTVASVALAQPPQAELSRLKLPEPSRGLTIVASRQIAWFLRSGNVAFS
jgi:hypothetical protein